MSRASIFIGLLRRSALWGLLLGAGLSLLCAAPMLCLLLSSIGWRIEYFSSAVALFIYSAILGVLLGGIGGSILAALTLIFYYRAHPFTPYKITAAFVMSITTFISCLFLWLVLLKENVWTGEDGWIAVWFIGGFTFVATGAALFASQRVAMWYVDSAIGQRSSN